MTGPITLTAANPAIVSATAPGGSERERLAEAARQFEAIFVRQMLAAARNADLGGDELFGGGAGEETFREVRDARFAEVAASTGALGLATTIEAQLARFVEPGGN
ncbi:rod-binding protein [Pelagerythrobacter rhizovicinus]|uniref:Flagellar biosynthesis protein FlgJ n=1 Tax=Pelagerythrobacter rhizovicinus TaxID=2268576 RepID=A0A4Q2KJ50_9SPHN|nr:rod-binding protein [Pelagerythrobacter rhizovicinus]RXZ65235.1 flagellar biosynthesis protein FlgJ [Pelagerythrobacter rhizovicinus]